MDAWSGDQLKKMQAGGNGKMNTFFKNYGIAKEIDIKEKYAGQVAEVRLKSTSTRLDVHNPGGNHGLFSQYTCIVLGSHRIRSPQSS